MEGYQFFGISLIAAILGSALFGLVLRVLGAISRGRNVGNRWELAIAIGLQALAAIYFSANTFFALIEVIQEIEHFLVAIIASMVFPIVIGLYSCTYACSLFMLILCYRAGEVAYDKLFPDLVARRENESWQRAEALIDQRIKSENARLRK